MSVVSFVVSPFSLPECPAFFSCLMDVQLRGYLVVLSWTSPHFLLFRVSHEVIYHFTGFNLQSLKCLFTSSIYVRAPLASTPVWVQNFNSSEELITEFCRECRIVRKGLAGDLKKAMKDGKPIIIEGIHLDPSIYLMDDENKEPANVPERSKEVNTVNVTSDENSVTQVENNSAKACGDHTGNSKSNHIPDEGICADQVDNVAQSLESLDLTSISDNKGETIKETEVDIKAPVKKEKSGTQPIIIPIVLKMAEFDHKALLEEWISTRKISDKRLIQDKDSLIANLKTIQDYLCSFKSQGLSVVNISATTFPQTLDWLHGYLLQRIEQGISSVSSPSAPK
ncbi:hypothetical protein SLEP1_g28056 [Rubroshorea leprosula]|uniref:Uncharacterized protein n=1 Tax=Rubroshorea leprosula TaxID=152421 RepID=A0AAV5JSE1_9ROSI|nr:hypothetical protein SLEP1_g28056 [Rubroshorea leprosula]